MAEEIEQAENTPQGGEGQPQGEPDYKAMYEKAVAESRKWESRSKANYEKAQKWDEAEEKSRTVEEQNAALKAENKALKDAQAHAEIVKQVAASTGVPESIVSTLNGLDEETLTAQAKAIAESQKPTAGAPDVPEAGKFDREQSGGDDMRAFAHNLFSRK